MSDYPVNVNDLRIRDPFVLPMSSEGRYYMYASGGTVDKKGFMVYTSKDLQNWSEPSMVFEASGEYDDCRDFWAPEVHVHNGRYYLFATLKASGKYRGTHIFVSDSPMGPFCPVSFTAATPPEWECLDGTLFVEDGVPYMVFCHEWTQVRNGLICAMAMKDDLSAPAGNAICLFAGSDAPWAPKGAIDADDTFPRYVTDGPFLYRSANGRLLMLWSSFGKGDYTVGLAESKNGRIDGIWFQHERPVYENGGHCMVFRDLNGQLRLALHSPNHGKLERAKFLPLSENADGLLEITESK